MLNELQRKTILSHVQHGDAEAIHQMISVMRVADQKLAKSVLSHYLEDRKICSLQQCLILYTRLMKSKLNLYFKSFELSCDKLKKEPDFWQNIEYLRGIGQIFCENKVYYRQTVIRIFLKHAGPDSLIDDLFEVMQVTEPKAKLVYLMDADSLYAMYHFMHTANSYDVDPIFIAHCLKQLLTNDKSVMPMHRREDLVNFMTHYFNGVNVHFPFHRTFDAVQMAYAESSFEAFSKVIVPSKRIDL